jgi:hypothetical protein
MDREDEPAVAVEGDDAVSQWVESHNVDKRTVSIKQWTRKEM